MALSPGVGDIYTIPLVAKQITTSAADVATAVVPFKGRVIAISIGAAAAGGSTVMTDLDMMVEKGTTDLHTLVPVVNSSTLASPLAAALVSTAASLAVAVGDILHLDATVTGGSSPTCDECVALVYVARE